MRTPFISLENVKGVSLKDVSELKHILEVKANSLKGNEVIMELCQLVQEFLYERNKPPEGSFFEGMLQHHAAVEHERKEQRVKSEEREREEVMTFQKMREEKLMWRKAEESEASTPVDDGSCDVFSCVDGARKRIIKSSNNFQRRPNTDIYCREWSATDCSTGGELFITEWNLNAKAEIPLSSFKTFVTNLQQIETRMQKISQTSIFDPTLYSYKLLCIQKNKLTLSEVDIGIIIGQDISISDKALLSQTDIFETDGTLLVRLANQLLHGLQFLHRKDIGHFNLDLSSVWVTSKRNFRISDYNLRALVVDLCAVFKECTSKASNISPSLLVDKAPCHDLIALGDIFDKFMTLSSITNSPGFLRNLENFVKVCRIAKSLEVLMKHPFVQQDDAISSLLRSTDCGKAGFQQVAHSRLQNEFVFIEMLGKGGFGDVMLAKNLLDGNDYAIKRIPLDPKDERFNRKVIREAKLFSKLNHPNVVRYYSAWIEHALKNARLKFGDSGDGESNFEGNNGDSLMPLQIRNIEKMAKRLPPDATAEWSTSFQPASAHEQTFIKDELCKGSVETLFSPCTASAVESSDFEVIFEEDDDSGKVENESNGETSKSSSESPVDASTKRSQTFPLRILFIQMEYCEKSTLRSLIDGAKLTKNARQIWRLFGEILLGLQYIHQEGMIHRDIKPMNILIDGNDHAKIGDFGLATLNIVSKNTSSLNDPDISSSMTKDIGTALYVAPELLSSTSGTAEYTTKIDVYSLGIVLFEMFYRPLLPGMERIMIIKSLRDSGHFPSDYGSGIVEVHQRASKKLIKWMLETKPDNRPSVQNLLESDRFPVVEIEENDFQKMFCQALRSNGGRLHHWIMDTLFANPVPPAVDYLYDRAICSTDRLILPRLRAAEHVRSLLSNICSTHAFIPFDVHSFTPFNIKTATKLSTSKSRTCRFIDENGNTIMLPYNLQRAFARYCVRNGVNRLKRYACGKVFGRSDALGGIHPIERVEFAIDSIGPISSSQMLTADVLCVMMEAAHRLSSVSSQKWEIRMGHRNLIIASALYLGFGDTNIQNKIMNIFYTIATSNKILSHEQKIERLRVGAEMSFTQANSLLNVLEGDDCSLEALSERTKCLVNCRDDRIGRLAKTALDDLTDVASLLESFCDDMTAHVFFDGTLCYRPQTYSSGLMFQLRILFPHKQSMRPVVLGAGGRYDSVLKEERHAQDPAPPNPLCIVGCALSLDVIAQLYCTNTPDFGSNWCQALVCSTSGQFLKTTASLVKQMWYRGIQTDVLHDPVIPVQMMELVEHCNEKKIEMLLVVIDESEVLARVGDVDLGKLTIDEVLNKLEIYHKGGGVVDTFSHLRNVNHSTTGQSVNTVASVTATAANLNVRYAVAEKPAAYMRKRVEAQIRTCLQKVVAVLAPQTVIEVIVSDIPNDAVRLLATLIDRNFSVEELSCAFMAAVKQLNKFKKELKRMQETIEPFFNPKNTSPVVLYSKQTSSGYYKLLL